MKSGTIDLQQKWSNRVRSLLDTSTIKDSRALNGTLYLKGLPDKELLYWFNKLAIVKLPIPELISEMKKKRADCNQLQDSLVYAFRRLLILGLPIAAQLKKQAQEAKKPKIAPVSQQVVDIQQPKKVNEFVLPIELSHENDFEDVLFDCYAKSSTVSGIEELQLLTEIQKRRMLRLLRMYATQPNPFLMGQALDRAIDGYRRTLDVLAEFQLRTNSMPTGSTPLDRRVDAVFGLYQKELSEGAPHVKDQMLVALVKFVETLQNDYAAKRVPDLRSGADDPDNPS